MRKGFLQSGIWLLAIFLLGAGRAFSAESLVWHDKEKTFDADVSKMELRNVLQEVSTLTGWEIYLEPGTSSEVSVKFKNLPRNDALRRLLGKLNYELSPQSNSVPKLFVFRTGAGNATQRIGAEKKSVVKVEKDKPIPNHLIVTLKPGSKISIEVLAQQLGAKVIGKLDGLGAYLLEFSDEAAANAARDQLSKVSDVASVDSNIALGKPEPVNMASVNGNSGSPFNLKASAIGGDGNNVVVGLIDTSVQQLNSEMQGFLLPALSVTGDDAQGGDVPTHGTMMAEAILYGAASMAPDGHASSIRILPVNIYDGNESAPTGYGGAGGTTTFNVAKGIVAAVNNNANVLSMSLGGEGDTPFLKRLLEDVKERGIPVLAAAGNQPVTTPTFPAAYPTVIAVTASEPARPSIISIQGLNNNNPPDALMRQVIAEYANRGSFVDVIVPGATVVSFKGAQWYANGTSVATALASGMMAGLAERSGTPPAQLESTFRERLRFHPPRQ